MIGHLKRGYERLLEIIVIILMAAMSVVVTVGIVYRTAGAALVWYDEVASVLLAWLTYYGAALAALKRAHIGVPEVMRALPPGPRAALFWLAEVLVIGFFALTAWIGYEVMQILEGTMMVSLPSVPEQVVQSIIPIGAVLFILAELLSLPEAWTRTMAHGRAAAHGSRDLASDMASTE